MKTTSHLHFFSQKTQTVILFAFLFERGLTIDEMLKQLPFVVVSVDSLINQEIVWALIKKLPVTTDHLIGSVVEESSWAPFVRCAKCRRLHCSSCSIYNACQSLQRRRIHSEIGALLERETGQHVWQNTTLTLHMRELKSIIHNDLCITYGCIIPSMQSKWNQPAYNFW